MSVVNNYAGNTYKVAAKLWRVVNGRTKVIDTEGRVAGEGISAVELAAYNALGVGNATPGQISVGTPDGFGNVFSEAAVAGDVVYVGGIERLETKEDAVSVGSEGTPVIYGEVIHDGSLSGKGTLNEPLGVLDVNVSHDSSLTGDGTAAQPLSVSVKTNGSMDGDGTENSPLRLARVIHDDTLQGLGVDGDALRVTDPVVVHNEFFNGDGTAAFPLELELEEINRDLRIAEKLETVEHDGSLDGDGTAANPLTVKGGGSVVHNASMHGNGTAADPLGILVNRDHTLLGDGDSQPLGLDLDALGYDNKANKHIVEPGYIELDSMTHIERFNIIDLSEAASRYRTQSDFNRFICEKLYARNNNMYVEVQIYFTWRNGSIRQFRSYAYVGYGDESDPRDYCKIEFTDFDSEGVIEAKFQGDTDWVLRYDSSTKKLEIADDEGFSRSNVALMGSLSKGFIYNFVRKEIDVWDVESSINAVESGIGNQMHVSNMYLRDGKLSDGEQDWSASVNGVSIINAENDWPDKYFLGDVYKGTAITKESLERLLGGSLGFSDDTNTALSGATTIAGLRDALLEARFKIWDRVFISGFADGGTTDDPNDDAGMRVVNDGQNVRIDEFKPSDPDVYYTLDGSDPDKNSTPYNWSTFITVSGNSGDKVCVKVAAYYDGYKEASIRTGYFKIA